MAVRVCTNGHRYEKTSDCPVCPECSSEEMKNKYADEFPPIGAPAFRALHTVGIETLSDLTEYSEKELLGLPDLAPKH